MWKKIFIWLFQLSFYPVVSQTIITVAGTGSVGYTGDGGPATSANVNYTKGCAYDAMGNIYIADSWNNVIRKINASGIITTIAGTGVQGDSGNGGPATSAQLYHPYGIVVAPSGDIYFSDTYNNCVKKISATGTISLVAGNSSQGYSGDGSLAVNAQLYHPFGLALDAAGNIIIADCFNNAVRKVTAATGIISTIAGTITSGFSGDGGPATAALLAGPSAVAFDAAGNLFIADYSNNRIRKINTSGTISTYAGNGTGAFGGDGGLATAASLWIPTGVGVDAAGNVYIADHNNARIRMVNTSGTITTIAGNGSMTDSGDGGPAISAGMSLPEEIAVDPVGNVYIALSGGYRVRKVIAATSGIKNTEAFTSFNTYPNPFEEVINIRFDKPMIVNLEIFGSNGNSVWKKQYENESGIEVDLTALQSGIYFAILTDENNNRYKNKLIKK
jgi:sugar lactone lactonase YvrE